jgi:transcriptional regulator of acetoin/glycerol metabolism
MKTDWNVSQAAAQLQLSRMTLYRKMAKYQIVRSHP